MFEERVNDIERKSSQNYKGKSDYEFSKCDEEVNLFSSISKIVMKNIDILILNIHSLDL